MNTPSPITRTFYVIQYLPGYFLSPQSAPGVSASGTSDVSKAAQHASAFAAFKALLAEFPHGICDNAVTRVDVQVSPATRTLTTPTHVLDAAKPVIIAGSRDGFFVRPATPTGLASSTRDITQASVFTDLDDAIVVFGQACLNAGKEGSFTRVIGNIKAHNFLYTPASEVFTLTPLDK